MGRRRRNKRRDGSLSRVPRRASQRVVQSRSSEANVVADFPSCDTTVEKLFFSGFGQKTKVASASIAVGAAATDRTECG